MPFAAALDGTRIAYEVQGSGAPLLLLSGQASDRHLWDRVLPDFVARFRVIRFDYRGSGESDKPKSP